MIWNDDNNFIKTIRLSISFMDTFGKKRLIDFYLDPEYININHGSYGSCPRIVMDAKRKL